jgi:hypothetical protein
MAATTGGSMTTLSIAGRIFAVVADNDAKRKLGGYSNKIEMNGDGSARLIKLLEAWEVGDVVVSCDDVRGDQEFLKGIQAKQDFVRCLFSFPMADYSGDGQLTDQVEFSSQSATAKLSFMGASEPGLEKQ